MMQLCTTRSRNIEIGETPIRLGPRSTRVRPYIDSPCSTLCQKCGGFSRFERRAVDSAGLVLLETGTDGDRLLGLPLSGGNPKVLATLENVGDLGVAADATHAYVGTFDGIIAVLR
jgi:hypothetical protein